MSSRDPSTIKDLLENLRPMKKIVANELKGKDFKSVLEIGCQWGESLKAIQNIFPDKFLTGIDIDSSELDKAKKIVSGINFIWANADQIPFLENSYDVVFTNALFCMVLPNDVESILNEIIRVAKKYIYLVELDDNKFLINIIDKDRVACNWEALFKSRGLIAHKRKITEEEWDCLPWKHYGYLIFVDKSEKINPIL